jgi:hypothetical protein
LHATVIELARPVLNALRSWWRARRRHTRFGGVVRVDARIDPDHALRARRLVLIGDPERPKWLRFLCPCGCGEELALNLMASHAPRWCVSVAPDGCLSVWPSVDVRTCGSHFWIERNRVRWV